MGELACRGDSVMMGYWRAPDKTAEVLDEEGWYYTGDLATIDEQGYLRIVGRKTDMIIRGGQNIYPAEIETYLAAHDRAKEVAVVGVPAPIAVDEEKIVPEASFFSDLCVDSIRMVDMMLRLEELGISIPLEVAWQIETVEDAYRCCIEHAPLEARRFRPPSEAAV